MFKSFVFRSLIKYDSTNQKSNKQKKAYSSISCKIRQSAQIEDLQETDQYDSTNQKGKNQTSKRKLLPQYQVKYVKVPKFLSSRNYITK